MKFPDYVRKYALTISDVMIVSWLLLPYTTLFHRHFALHMSTFDGIRVQCSFFDEKKADCS